MAFADAEAGGNGFGVLAGVDQRRHRGEFVGRVHRRPHRVFHQRGFERGIRLLDEARHLIAGRDHAFGGKLLQCLQAPAAGGDGIDPVSLGCGADDEVLLQPAGLEARLELGVLRRRGRGLPCVGRRQDKPVEGDVSDSRCRFHARSLHGGRTEPSLVLQTRRRAQLGPFPFPASNPERPVAMRRRPQRQGSQPGWAEPQHAASGGSLAACRIDGGFDHDTVDMVGETTGYSDDDLYAV